MVQVFAVGGWVFLSWRGQVTLRRSVPSPGWACGHICGDGTEQELALEEAGRVRREWSYTAVEAAGRLLCLSVASFVQVLQGPRLLQELRDRFSRCSLARAQAHDRPAFS